jgi:phosphatidylserine decarboxylase
VAREGIPFVGGAVLLSLLCWLASDWIAALIYVSAAFGVLTAFVVFFFRDPERTPPSVPGAILSAADGKVISIERLDEEEEYLEGPGIRVTVFLSVFNVHINRIPMAGKVDFVDRRTGRFLVAYAPEASKENQQSIIGISNGSSRLIVKQIVGIVARRIVCYLKAGDEVTLGRRFGLIRFGSRVDLILPEGVDLRVGVGDRVRGGETVIGVCLPNV